MVTNTIQNPNPAQEKPFFLLRRVAHPLTPTFIFGILAFGITFISLHFHPRSLLSTLALLSLGVIFWTPTEYVLHRFVFHLTQVKEPWKTMASGLHMAHHRNVQTQDLIIAPPGVAVIFSTLIYLFSLLFTQSFAISALLISGLFIGYIFYEWAHFSAHRYHPKNKIAAYLKQYHLMHHFKYPNRVFGVTNPFWDWIFGTYSK